MNPITNLVNNFGVIAWLGIWYFAAVLPIVLWYAFAKQRKDDKDWPPRQEDCQHMYWWSPPRKDGDGK